MIRYDIVVEIVVIDTSYCPVGTSEVYGHTCHIGLQHGRERRIFEFRAKLYTDSGIIVRLYTSGKYVDFIERSQVIFHRFHYLVKLLHRTAFRHPCTYIKRLLFRLAIEISPVEGTVEQTERRARPLVDPHAVVSERSPRKHRTHIFFIERSLLLLLRLRYQEQRQSEHDYKYQDIHPAMPDSP